jgi:UDP-N-acetylglucosamine 1-carboxyvinyltransferase
MSETLVCVEGQHVLNGELQLSGAKNAALPLIVAACMGAEPTILENVPVGLVDIQNEIALLKALGACINVIGNSVWCSRGDLSNREIDSNLVGRIRSSLLLLGLFSALRSNVFIKHPGGDQIGERKYDLHLMGLRMLGAQIQETEAGIYLSADKLTGANIDFYLPTTTGTENIMLAGALADGVTVLRNANTRPEIIQLGNLLNAMGARLKMQSRVVEMEGVEVLRGGVHFTVMPGWDEAVTYIIATAATRSEIAIKDFTLSAIKEDTRYLREAGVGLFEWHNNVYVSGKGELRPFDLFTAPYPGVNSDMQPIYVSLAQTITGTSTITDLRFTDRFQYVEELKRFGGDIESFGNTAIVRGGKKLIGTRVKATDIRGGMACLIAGLTAEGETEICNITQMRRGYEDFVRKLSDLGAFIKEVNES